MTRTQNQPRQRLYCSKCDVRNQYNRMPTTRRRHSGGNEARMNRDEEHFGGKTTTKKMELIERDTRRRSLVRLIKWPLAHLCLPFCLHMSLISLLLLLLLSSSIVPMHCLSHRDSKQEALIQSPADMTDEPAADLAIVGNQFLERALRTRRSPWAAVNRADRGERATSSSFSSIPNAGQQRTGLALLMPINELRVSGSKLEPPSRPSQDWSKQRPYFGQQVERNVSVELGKTAHLTCKVFELGDKTVSWLRPSQNEILTAGRYTYIGDARFSSMNEPQGSADWILEIKDVQVSDGTSYECQVSTDPKMSMTINLHVKAARARIKQGENNYYPLGANLEFTCDILAPSGASRHYGSGAQPSSSLPPNQIYWYHNGDLINYARNAAAEVSRSNTNFTIDWDPVGQLSRLRLFNIQTSDSGNYTCKPTAAEPATVRLFVKKHRANTNANRVHYNGGVHHVPNNKEAQRGRQQHYNLDATNGIELSDSPATSSSSPSSLLNLRPSVSQFGLWISFQLMMILLIVANHTGSKT